jgi:hypothetical protein
MFSAGTSAARFRFVRMPFFFFFFFFFFQHMRNTCPAVLSVFLATFMKMPSLYQFCRDVSEFPHSSDSIAISGQAYCPCRGRPVARKHKTRWLVSIDMRRAVEAELEKSRLARKVMRFADRRMWSSKLRARLATDDDEQLTAAPTAMAGEFGIPMLWHPPSQDNPDDPNESIIHLLFSDDECDSFNHIPTGEHVAPQTNSGTSTTMSGPGCRCCRSHSSGDDILG